MLAGRGLDTYDTLQAIVTFDGGLSAVFEASWILPETLPMVVDVKYEVIGSDGALYVDWHDQGLHHVTSAGYRHPIVASLDVYGRPTGMPISMLDSFITCVDTGTQPPATWTTVSPPSGCRRDPPFGRERGRDRPARTNGGSRSLISHRGPATAVAW